MDNIDEDVHFTNPDKTLDTKKKRHMNDKQQTQCQNNSLRQVHIRLKSMEVMRNNCRFAITLGTSKPELITNKTTLGRNDSIDA